MEIVPNLQPNLFGLKVRHERPSAQYLRPNLEPIYQDELTDLSLKASLQMAQTINEVGIEQLKRVF